MKTRLFADTNIILDLLGQRLPYYYPIAKIATLAEKEEISLVVSPLSYATVNYFLTKYQSRAIAIDKLRKFKLIAEICELNSQIIEIGLNSDFKDFEDALQYFSAIKSNCSVILTRNKKDFKKSDISIMTADEFLAARND